MDVCCDRNYDAERATADAERPVSVIENSKLKFCAYGCFLLISIIVFAGMLACGIAGVAAPLYRDQYGDRPYLYHIGTAGCVLLLTVFETVTTILFFKVDQVQENKLLTFKTQNWTRSSYYCLTLKVFITTFFINVSLAVSLIGLTMVYNYPNVTSSVAYFIGVELLLGIAVPLLCLISAWMILVVIHSVAVNKLDVVRPLITYIFPSIHYEEGRWWVIADYFYISKKIRNPCHCCTCRCHCCTRRCHCCTHQSNQDSSHEPEPKNIWNPCHCCTRQSNQDSSYEPEPKPTEKRTAKKRSDSDCDCDFDCPTILIILILSLTFFIAVSYFVNAGVIRQNNFDSCSNVTRDYLESGIPCLSFRQRDIIDCTNQSATTGPVLCIQFIPFEDTAITLAVLTGTGVLFIITVTVIELLFFILKVLYKLYVNNLWLVLTFSLACVSFVGCIAFVILIYVLSWNNHILAILQVLVSCLNVIFATWLVCLRDPDETEKRNLSQIEGNDDTQETGKLSEANVTENSMSKEENFGALNPTMPIISE